MTITSANGEGILTQNATGGVTVSISAGNQLTVQALSKTATHAYDGTLAKPTSINLDAKNIDIYSSGYGLYGQVRYAQVNATAQEKIKITSLSSAAIRGQVNVRAKEVEILTSSSAIQTNGNSTPESFTTVNIGTLDNPIEKLTIYGTKEKTGLTGNSAAAIQLWRVYDKINIFADNIVGEVASGTAFIQSGGDSGVVNMVSNTSIDITGDITFVGGENSKVAMNGYIDDNGNFQKSNAKVILNGNVQTLNNGDEVVINLATSDSVLNGYVKDSDLAEKGGTYLMLNNGATWNANKESESIVTNKIKNIQGNQATINLGNNQLFVDQLNSEDKNIGINVSGNANQVNINQNITTNGGKTVIQTQTAMANQIAVQENKGTLEIQFVNPNVLSGDNKEASQQVVQVITLGGASTEGYVAKVKEDDVLGERTFSVDKDNQIVSIKEQKSQTMQSLTELGFDGFQTFRSQMNDLDKRMGDLRTMPQASGAWARAFAGQSKYKSTHNNYKTLQAGVDHRMGNFFAGVMASYTDGDGSVKMGDTDDKNYSFGLYGGWLADNGQFVDITIKRHHLESDYDLRYRNGDKSKGSYHTAGTSISAEYGWRLPITNTNFYVEPQVEFMYGHLNSVGYTTSNGVKVNQSAGKTAVGRLGAALGYVSPDKSGSAYIKASVLNDWEGDMKTRVSKGAVSRYYRDDMGGTWGEFAIGGTYNLNKDWSIYGEAETTAGNPVRTTYQFSAGVRYSF